MKTKPKPKWVRPHEWAENHAWSARYYVQLEGQCVSITYTRWFTHGITLTFSIPLPILEALSIAWRPTVAAKIREMRNEVRRNQS